ncbi:peptide MFS transporter [Novosphingobium sp. G106]|uniref:peptide MFS transporter n=1 Tax=Novosphingobium sp. G106 TaxID=2849500 RepID=UPI001C2DE165|nr:peptide MFS transporter [Novosphingobium sp. G106]MBV1687020.1 peptide MFS transporter [Novosphingobium sp. G106]
MTVAEATPDIELPQAAPDHDRAFLGHPKGLGYLAFVEGCERFSYYSMQTLLTLYMVNYLLLPEHSGSVLGLGWLQQNWYGGKTGQPLASDIFGNYTALVYLTPILGGILADKWLGRRGALVAGGLIMSLGHFLMAIQPAFLLALLCLIVGVGLFKGNIATQVGELYGPDDLRRAMAFQIFYIAIQVSVIVAPLISGTLGENVGWHYGFGCAGVVMVLGLLLYLKARPHLPIDKRDRPATARIEEPSFEKGDGARIAALLVLVPALAVSLLPNQEIFNAYLVWADQHFDLTFLGMKVPTSWMITLDSAMSFVTLVGITWFWKWYGDSGRPEPDELGKLVIGSVFTVVGALCLYMAALTAGSGKVGLLWPVLFHFFNSMGFGHVLPVSLALVTKIAPRKLAATSVGIYYLSFFLANYVVGKVGGWYSTMPIEQFWLVHVGAAVVGLVAFVLFKLFLSHRFSDEARA